MRKLLSGGLFAALKGVPGTLLAVVRTRLQLFGNELQTAKLNVLRDLSLVLAMVAFAALGVVLAVVLALSLLWEQRLFVLSFLSVLFIGLAVTCYAVLRRSLQTSDHIFAASLAELQEDLRQLKAEADHGQEAR